MSAKRIALWAALVVVVAGGVVTVWSRSFSHPSDRVNYPYVCRDCKAVFDYQDLKADDYKNWKVPPGAPSESIALCLKCGKGWAFPVVTCSKCKTQHIAHIVRDSRCPKCYPQAAEAARKAGVDVSFKP